METATDHPRITFDLSRNALPTVRGLPYAVWQVLELLASGRGEAELLAQHPTLEAEDFQACLLFAAARLKPVAPLALSMNGKSEEEWAAGHLTGPLSPREFLAHLIKTGKVPPDTKLSNDTR